MGAKMGPDELVTHGICDVCAAKEKATVRDTSRWCTNCGEKVPYDAPPEQVDCDNCVEEAKEEEEEDYTCYHCRGCGEGQFEGTVCPVCHGSGTILTEAHQAAKDEEDDRRADARQEAIEARKENEKIF
jgi:hypothetical protein